ncbi:hypothetical protein KP78_03730 [Jeotgalibacillus soli]|uniref:Uncharacterized protein n=1 Tax=Jeotgalibacillus soli TaxID=889306 RepID=A0A0C2W7M0_9BACL|nr:hypothetical protein KP78_03730 [Jeotgalibacillus soli]
MSVDCSTQGLAFRSNQRCAKINDGLSQNLNGKNHLHFFADDPS